LNPVYIQPQITDGDRTSVFWSKKGACLFYKEWNRPVNTLSSDPDEEKRLMFGMLYSIKGLVTALGSRVSRMR
jgi:hypothetical protein